jgi:hypothetical protein
LIEFAIGAHSQSIIPPEKITQIKECVEEKMKTGPIMGRLSWRTHYRYAAASNWKETYGYYRSSPCKIVESTNNAATVDQFKPIQNGDVVEGQLQTNGKLAPLPNCDRYKFIKPVGFWNEDGDAVHDVYVGLVNDKLFHCGFYTAGDGKIGGGGGHVYFGCWGRLEPVFNDKDRSGFLEICAREILR